MNFEYKFFDRYNWDKGKSVTINIAGRPVTITDAFMGEFHRMGLANEFNMKGSVYKVVKWRRGQAPQITDAQGPQGGGGGSGGR